MKNRLTILTTSLALSAMATTACVSHAHPAYAGGYQGWVLNKNACPDLIEDRLDRAEDRRDRRITFGPRDRREDRRDRRENRRDERIVNCPASAWTYIGPQHSVSPRPSAARIVITPSRQYYRLTPKGRITVFVR